MKSRSCRTTRRKSCAYTKFSLDDPFRPLTRRNALPNPEYAYELRKSGLVGTRSRDIS